MTLIISQNRISKMKNVEKDSGGKVSMIIYSHNHSHNQTPNRLNDSSPFNPEDNILEVM